MLSGVWNPVPVQEMSGDGVLLIWGKWKIILFYNVLQFIKYVEKSKCEVEAYQAVYKLCVSGFNKGTVYILKKKILYFK